MNFLSLPSGKSPMLYKHVSLKFEQQPTSERDPDRLASWSHILPHIILKKMKGSATLI